ncbi:Rmf/CrpP fold protein [Streptomyces alfalfae]|uniref:Rmf/CrpP fold protein n=1 Tax=Streptomyces alfalfae TaxID=1642299 RepID=UPI0028125BAA|nr:Rmf/CrpP fold protein [Streptomyces alfalfae]
MGESTVDTPEDLARAAEEGAEAKRRGDSYLTCRHPRPSALRTAWISGYHGTDPSTANQPSDRDEDLGHRQ